MSPASNTLMVCWATAQSLWKIHFPSVYLRKESQTYYPVTLGFKSSQQARRQWLTL
jgi:hypothetical protein